MLNRLNLGKGLYDIIHDVYEPRAAQQESSADQLRFQMRCGCPSDGVWRRGRYRRTGKSASKGMEQAFEWLRSHATDFLPGRITMAAGQVLADSSVYPSYARERPLVGVSAPGRDGRLWTKPSKPALGIGLAASSAARGHHV
jgi:hypothetical protein